MIRYDNITGFLSFFYMFPNILFRYRGSVVVTVIPQIILTLVVCFIYDRMDFTLSSSPFKIMGFPLAFLVVYKSKAAYQQYWEGRTEVENLVFDCKNIAMQVMSYTTPREGWGQEEKQSVALAEDNITRWLKLFLFLVIEHLQNSSTEEAEDDEEDMAQILRLYKPLIVLEEERDALRSLNSEDAYSRAKPLVVLEWISQEITKHADLGRMNKHQFKAIDRNVNDLMKSLSTMSKINQMQFPFPLTQLIMLYQILYLFLLPAALLKTLNGWAYFVSALTSLAYYGIEEVGTSLESPFGTEENDLPLVEYAYAACRELDMLLLSHQMRSHGVVDKAKPGADVECYLAAWSKLCLATCSTTTMDTLVNPESHLPSPSDKQVLAQLNVDLSLWDRTVNLPKFGKVIPPPTQSNVDKSFFRTTSWLPRNLSRRVSKGKSFSRPRAGSATLGSLSEDVTVVDSAPLTPE